MKTPSTLGDVRPVPDGGWACVAQIKGALPELHRGRYVGDGDQRRFVTACDITGRWVADIPIGAKARLCPTCLTKKPYRR